MARVLVADDSSDMRKLLSTLLVDSGHSVALASNGTEAIDEIRKQAPDLVILDIMMPGLDGFDVLREMKQSGILEDVKVMILTARSSETDIVKGYKMGADVYITKPFAPEEMLDQVQHMLETPKRDLRGSTQQELEKAQMLSRLESLFSDL